MRSRLLFVRCMLSLLALLPGAAWGQGPGKQPDTSYLRTLAETRSFMLGRPSRPLPTPDGKAILFLRSQPRVAKLGLFEFDVAGGKTRELVTPEQVLKGAEEKLSPEEKAQRERMRVSVGGFTNFQLSPDGKQVLLALSGRLYLFTRDSGAIRELPTGAGPQPVDEPVCGLVGDFGGDDSADPVCGVGDFESACARYLRTVARSKSNSRAIRRLDQPCRRKATIVCC